jgi:hypothetical protein
MTVLLLLQTISVKATNPIRIIFLDNVSSPEPTAHCFTLSPERHENICQPPISEVVMSMENWWVNDCQGKGSIREKPVSNCLKDFQT